MSDLKTKKKRDKTKNKKQLWAKFDAEIVPDDSVECVYESKKSGERTSCDCCGFSLVVTPEGFPACTNRSCGVIYTDTLDQSAEWRYYGADDSSSSDPTRCGMPINSLLPELSSKIDHQLGNLYKAEIPWIEQLRWGLLPPNSILPKPVPSFGLTNCLYTLFTDVIEDPDCK